MGEEDDDLVMPGEPGEDEMDAAETAQYVREAEQMANPRTPAEAEAARKVQVAVDALEEVQRVWEFFVPKIAKIYDVSWAEVATMRLPEEYASRRRELLKLLRESEELELYALEAWRAEYAKLPE